MSVLKNIVVKIGGSILFPDGIKPSVFLQQIEKLGDFLTHVKSKNADAKVFVIIGGGSWAKNYIKFAESVGISPIIRDNYGITISRLNADIVMRLLSSKTSLRISPVIPETPNDVFELSKSFDAIIVGGFYPGQSTIGTAALLSEIVNADLLLIATDVPGVYLEDPKINPSARKFKKIDIASLKKILLDLEAKPGTYKLMDFVAVKTLERSKIPTIIFDGSDLGNLSVLYEAYTRGDLEKVFELGTIIEF